MKSKYYQGCILIYLLFLTLFNVNTGTLLAITLPHLTASEMPADTVIPSTEKYIWPTDASKKITSSFAEYRSTHFHGGIDISTNGVKGYKVFAVLDGYVYRIKITPNGYGKMLFIRQKDGYISTFAHLQGFNDAITRAAREEQYKRGTYAIDVTFSSGKLPVKQGEVVAYTGDTGFGPPHLHYELRDQNLNTVNPFLVARYPTQDHLPPVIKRVLITPLTYNSTIDNSTTPKILSRFPRGHDGVKIPQNFIFHGEIGFGVEAIDHADGTWSHSGIYSLEFFIDDSLAFSMALDHVPADETKEIDLHYDFHMILQGWGQFQKLYIDSGNTLPLYHDKPEGTGIINTAMLSEGTHNYTITCADFSGNKTSLRGHFSVNHSPSVLSLEPKGSHIILHGSHLDLVHTCEMDGKNYSSHAWTLHAIDGATYLVNDSTIDVPFEVNRYDIVKVITVSKWGSRTPPIFSFHAKPPEAVRPVYCKTEILNNFVRFTLTSTGIFTMPPVATIQEGIHQQRIQTEAVDLYKYTATYIPSSSFAGSRKVTVSAEVNGKPSSTTDSFEIFSIPPGNSGAFGDAPIGLQVSYDSAAVYKPLYMQISSEPFKNSTVYILEPQDQLLNRGIRVSIPFENHGTHSHQGLFFRANGGWVFQTDQPDTGGKTISTTLTRTLGELAILRDDQEPTIGRLRVGSRKGIVSLSCRYRDNLSGVDTDEIKVYIDGKLVIPEVDGEHHLVSYTGEEQLNHGKHQVKISMKDRMKNQSVVSRTFTVR
jgi:hypothetical protein